MSSHPVEGAQADLEFARAFFDGLRRHPWLAGAWIVFVMERNTGHEAGHVSNLLLTRDTRAVAVRQKANKDYGWWTSNDMKIGYAAAGRTRLRTKSVAMLGSMVCTNPFADSEKTDDDLRSDMRAELSQELSRVREVSTRSDNPLATSRTTVSGKVGEDGKVMHGQNDDLFITFCMACFFTSMFIEERIPFLDYRKLDS